jgi:hypothetical protein
VANSLARRMFSFEYQRIAIYVQPRYIWIWPHGDFSAVPDESEVSYVE